MKAVRFAGDRFAGLVHLASSFDGATWPHAGLTHIVCKGLKWQDVQVRAYLVNEPVSCLACLARQ